MYDPALGPPRHIRKFLQTIFIHIIWIWFRVIGGRGPLTHKNKNYIFVSFDAVTSKSFIQMYSVRYIHYTVCEWPYTIYTESVNSIWASSYALVPYGIYWPSIYRIRSLTHLVRDSSAVRRLFSDLLEPSDVRELYIRKTADLPLQLSCRHISMFRGYRCKL